MRFSTLFNLRKPAAQPPITSDSLPTQPPLASDSLLPATLPPEVIGGERRSSEVIGAKTEIPPWFLPDEKIGGVMWDRARIELDNRPFTEMEENLYPLLALPQLKRCCMDSMGNGSQLHERAKERFGWKADGIKFTPALKEKMAYALRADFEDRKLRLVSDDNLRSDLRALKKQITAARYRPMAGGLVP